MKILDVCGWTVLRLTRPPIEVDVLPQKGGDILAVRWLETGTDLLFRSPWGLRTRGVSVGGTSVERWLAAYPGGWQTIFPNGGDPVTEGGCEWGFHGEAALAAWDHEPAGDGVELQTELATAPFALTKRIEVSEGAVRITETVTNTGGVPVEAMWSHHPAFGAPFLSGACTVETDASTFVADDVRDTEAGDLEPGASVAWPHARTRDGGAVDLSRVPSEGSRVDRFGYLTGFERGRAAVRNPDLGLTAELRWDATVLPHAWYWLEANATPGYPWYRRAYVFAIEPASSYPGQGLHAVREKTGTQISFAPGASRTIEIELVVSSG